MRTREKRARDPSTARVENRRQRDRQDRQTESGLRAHEFTSCRPQVKTAEEEKRLAGSPSSTILAHSIQVYKLSVDMA